MCNCRGRTQPLVGEPVQTLPVAGESVVWFWNADAPNRNYAVFGGVSGRTYYLRHNRETKVLSADADWLIQHPGEWVPARPENSVLAKQGVGYGYFTPSESGTYQGASVSYTLLSGQKMVVLTDDLPGLMETFAGTVQ